MELKVWVDGIQRVVCGVTDNTTCQDVVIALAHAMGRTGKFTLVEKWREKEHRVPPAEFPLRLLYKWGEYASEVQFHLYQSDKLPHKKDDVKLKAEDRLKNNFSPPPKQCENIKRSLTFSGAHHSFLPPLKKREKVTVSEAHVRQLNQNERNRQLSENTESTKSVASKSKSHHIHSPSQKNSTSSPSPVDQGYVTQQEKDLSPPHSSKKPTPPPRHTPVSKISEQTHTSLVPSRTGPSAFQPVRPRRIIENQERNSPNIVNTSNIDVPVYSVGPNGQSSLDVEEYDLDSNFPDIVKDASREVLIEEYLVPEKEGFHTKDKQYEKNSDPEFVKLWRLVSQQQERIKIQESQLQLIDTELSSLDEKDREAEEYLKTVIDDIAQLEHSHKEYEADIMVLGSGRWGDELETQQELDKHIQSEISDIRSRLIRCESELKRIQERTVTVNRDLEEEKEEERKIAEKRKEEENKILQEIEKLQKELDTKKSATDEGNIALENLEEEVQKLEAAILARRQKVDSLEEQLKDVNMKDFSITPVPLGSLDAHDSEKGEAVLKFLEGHVSPALSKNRKLVVNLLSGIKNPNGVWV